MTDQVSDYSGDDTRPIPRADRRCAPPRQTGARRTGRPTQSAIGPTGPVPSLRRSHRQVVVERRRFNWWIVAGVAAMLLAVGVVVAGMISHQTRPGANYESVYLPQDSRQPVPR